MEPKKRVVKDYDKLPEDVLNRIKIEYPRGFVKHLIKYFNKDGVQVSALPYETEDMYYLIRMSVSEARQIILDDDDYEDGILREDFEDDIDDIDDGEGAIPDDIETTEELDDDLDVAMDDEDDDMDDED